MPNAIYEVQGIFHLTSTTLSINTCMCEKDVLPSIQCMASSSKDASASAPPQVKSHLPDLASGLKRNRQSSPSTDICAICLQPISERAVSYPCNHLAFDFICLAQWLQNSSVCPLCKAEVSEVHYDWRDADDYKTFHVRKDAPSQRASTSTPSSSSRGRRRNNVPVEPSDPSLERRRLVHEYNLFSFHIGSNPYSQYQTFDPAVFTSSPPLQNKARVFLRRELRVFSHLEPRRRDYLIEYIVAVLKLHDPKAADGEAERLVGEFVGRESARLVLHELEAWLRSPWERLVDWDDEMQYHGEEMGGADETTRKRVRP